MMPDSAEKSQVSRQGRPPAGSRTFPGAACFVGGVWAVLMTATLVLIYRHHSCLPYGEDWGAFLPVVLGTQPITLDWLWALEFEHRQFLMRLIGGGLLKLTHGDYWLLMLFFTLPLGGLALALVRVSGRLRGRVQYADAFLPLALLHWYMGEYLVWGTTLNYLLPTLLALAMLVIILRWGIQLSLGAAVAAGLCLVALPLCAAGGVVYLPPFLLWLFLCDIHAWRSPGAYRKAVALVLGVSMAAALLLVGLYFSNYGAARHYGTPSHDWRAVLKITAAFLTAGFGRSAASFWPYTGPPLLVLVAVSGGLVIAAIRRRRDLERWRAVGVFIFLGATLLLALAVSWGWSGAGLDYIWTYWLLPVPLLLCLFFIWGLYAPRAVGYFVQMCLLLIVGVATTLNLQVGLENLAIRKQAVDAVRQAVQAGMPPYQLLAQHGNIINGGSGRDIQYAELLEQMREAKVGVFAAMPPDPPFRAVPLEDLKPVEMHELQQDPQTGEYIGGENSYFTLALPQPQYVAAVRLTFADDPTDSLFGTLYFNWRTSGAANFPDDPPYFWGALGSLGVPRPIVADTIDQIRIYPNSQPFRCKLLSVELLIPETPAEPAAKEGEGNS